jgi:hypothetical protein
MIQLLRPDTMTLAKPSKYNPARGGHAPTDLRNSFLDAVDIIEKWGAGEPEPTVELRDHQIPVMRIIGLLWNCRDILAYGVCQQIDDMIRSPQSFRSGSTYAQGARQLKRLLDSRRTTTGARG